MSVTSGKYNSTSDVRKIAEWINQKCVGREKAHHIWTEETPSGIRSEVEKVRTSNEIMKTIQDRFPKYSIENVREADEIYWAVSPKNAKGSDRSLVDCHYDSPFGIIPVDSIFYRVIIACNENNDVTTVFPNDDVRVMMDIGDYHGLDYNKDWHCVEGKIPNGTYRVLLKLHYILTPKGRTIHTGGFVRSINVWWTKLSRWFMRMSAEPQNIFEHIAGAIVNGLRYIFNKTNPIVSVVLLVVLLIAIYYFFLRKRTFKKRR